MKKIFNVVFLFVMLFMIISFMGKYNVSAETIISEVKITSSKTYVAPGPLGSYTATSQTDGITVEEYGSNTGWSKWEVGYSSWHGFGTDTPTSVSGDTHYALRLSLKLGEGYVFSDSVKIYFNDEEVTNVGHTLLDKGFDWGGYLYIDLGVTRGPYTITLDPNNETAETNSIANVAYNGKVTLGSPTSYGFTTPENKVFNAWIVDGVRYEVGQEITVTSDMTAVALWNDDNGGAEPTFSVIYDFNGGMRHGEASYETNQVAYAPDISVANFIDWLEVDAPQGKELDAILVNGVRYELGTNYMLNCDTTYKYLWKDTNAGEPEPNGENVKINAINITILEPEVGAVITDTTKPNITIGNGAQYILDDASYVKAFPSIDPNNFGDHFTGTIEKGKSYYVTVSVGANGGYSFVDNEHMTLTVNGQTTNIEKGMYNKDGDIFYVFYVRLAHHETGQEYVVTDGGISLIFRDDEGQEYNVAMYDYTQMTDEQVVELGKTREELTNLLETISETVSEEGTLLTVLDINLTCEAAGDVHTVDGGFKIRIPMTDAMKEYNTFKLVYITGDLTKGEIIPLTRNGDYLEGTLEHLSDYAVVGSSVSNSQDNPQTNDGIMNWIIIILASTIGLFVACKLKRIYSK